MHYLCDSPKHLRIREYSEYLQWGARIKWTFLKNGDIFADQLD